ncbi:Bifunctional cytochrome P450/NADPH--P450 reductase 2 [Mycolicibacterium vanbaalenii]|uniref:Bifunctional cytochrome P450/NADPH--P450 reductase 2 n=1 Tax=Mycolicibacterium vanbaalenii TaxID=110539 RepID=A0A5S9QZS2_MYCVN|nr:cytochrome P450 [Mycolicibacterium vanbaalenii]CAA0125987.1 Bifunctional cytochrome P450/NADPH--P450 reductase 2 [Mycolicibacterium vanbaalenii]
MTAVDHRRSYPALPHPRRRLPLLGDVLGFSADSPSQSTMALADLGPLFEFRFLGARYVVAAGPEVVAELSDESRFCKHVGPDIDALRILGGDGLFTAYNDEPNWQKAHDVLMPAFSQQAMRRYHSIMFDVADELTARWDGRAARGVTVDVSVDATRVTLETIGRCAAGHPFGCFESEAVHPFVEHMVAGLKGSDRVGVLRQTFLPDFVARRAERPVRHHAARLHAIADEIIAERVRGGLGRHDDLLELMLTSDLQLANIRYQLINFLVAGHETTSGALSFALYYLSQHPEVVKKARAEIAEVWGDEVRPGFENIAKLRYVRRVFDEALRLQPTVPGYYREAREDTVLAGVHPMRKGDWVLALIGSLHRDPQWGPDPDAFDPDRFAPEKVRARPAGLYKPFGTGPRSCIGRQFALHEAVLLLAVLIRRYDVIADPDYQLQITERLTLMPKDFHLSLSRR